jgi:predicted acetyltransferase
MGIWKNAFKLPGHRAITEEEKKFLAGLALKINKRSMGNVAALALESTRPLHNLGSQALIFLTPILGAVFSKVELEKFVKLLETPRAIDFFLDELNMGEPKSDKKAVK